MTGANGGRAPQNALQLYYHDHNKDKVSTDISEKNIIASSIN